MHRISPALPLQLEVGLPQPLSQRGGRSHVLTLHSVCGSGHPQGQLLPAVQDLLKLVYLLPGPPEHSGRSHWSSLLRPRWEAQSRMLADAE